MAFFPTKLYEALNSPLMIITDIRTIQIRKILHPGSKINELLVNRGFEKMNPKREAPKTIKKGAENQ
jgi:hypothetical protein